MKAVDRKDTGHKVNLIIFYLGCEYGSAERWNHVSKMDE